MICNCCAGIAIETPQTIYNRSGLPTIAYRSGTWATFKASMLAQIGTVTAHGLRTRDDTDWTIAFMDSCAVVADILTFYDERNANENYLRTATETISLAELSALIGYTPSPGCSASAYLVFRINDPPPSIAPSMLTTFSSTLGALIPAGTQTQSVPGAGQTPQTFETAQDLDARWVHNALVPLLAVPYPIDDVYAPSIAVVGGTIPRVGDTIMLVSADLTFYGLSPQLQIVIGVSVDSITNVTTLTLGGVTLPSTASLPSGLPPGTFVPNNDTFSDSLVAGIVFGQSWDRDALATVVAREQWSMDDFEASVNSQNAAAPAGTDLSAYTVKTAALFGNNAPLWAALPSTLTTGTGAPYAEDWDTDNTLGTYKLSSWYTSSQIDLDAVYPSAVPGAWVLFVDTIGVIPGIIQTAGVVSRNIYAVSSRVTTLTVSTYSDPGLLNPRTTAVYIQDAPISLAPLPVYGPGQTVGGLTVLLNRCAMQLQAGGYVAVTGTRSDRQGMQSTEIAQLASVAVETGYTQLTFTEPLEGTYLPETVTINANVVDATNGATVTETLGSGDAGTPFQSFKLQQTPLTWTSASSPSGIAAAITVRVNGVAWTLVPYLYGAGPTDRVYMLDTDTSGNTLVRFGDGITGARVPTGNQNVTALYRRGIGTGANVDAAAISMLLSHPPGLRDVNNPLPASGGADPDTVAQSRENAPFSVETLGRIVTLDDYANFARATTGVAKARVDLTFVGATQVILITVAGPAGAAISPGTDQYKNLLAALNDASDGSYPIALATYQPITFSVGAAIDVDPAYEQSAVFAAIQAALDATFSFDARAFGQTVFASEIYAVIQSVPGVLAENLSAFDYTQNVPLGLNDSLAAQPASISGSTALGAQLLTIDIIPATLTVIAS